MTALSSERAAPPRAARTRNAVVRPRVGGSRRGSGAASAMALLVAEDSPWEARDLIRLIWTSLFGLVGLGVCWYGCGGEANFHRQIVWIAAAVGSLMVSGFGMVGWLLAGLRSVHGDMFELMTDFRLDVLKQTFDEPDDGLEPLPEVVAQVDLSVAGYVTSPSMTRVHRSDCPHVRGKAVGPISMVDIDNLGLTYCGVCCP